MLVGDGGAGGDGGEYSFVACLSNLTTEHSTTVNDQKRGTFNAWHCFNRLTVSEKYVPGTRHTLQYHRIAAVLPTLLHNKEPNRR